MFLITRRSKIWVINCRRDDLMKKDANYLYNQCRMCDEHFDASQFMDTASKHSLVWDAIPTTFPVRHPQHLLTPKRKAPTHRAPPVQEPGPSAVVTICCQLRINVISHGTVHRKNEELREYNITTTLRKHTNTISIFWIVSVFTNVFILFVDDHTLTLD